MGCHVVEELSNPVSFHRGGFQSRPRYKRLGSHPLRQQLLNNANIWWDGSISPDSSRSQVFLRREIFPGRQLQNLPLQLTIEGLCLEIPASPKNWELKDGGPSQVPMLACGERQGLWWWPHPLRMTQQYHLASMASWLSSTGISHDNLLPHIPWICLSAVNSNPCPGIAPKSLNSSSQQLRLPGVPVWGMHGCGKDWFSFHLGCHRSAISLSALNVSPLTQTTALMWGWDPCFSSPTGQGQVQPY